jgi:hypothetical protein
MLLALQVFLAHLVHTVLQVVCACHALEVHTAFLLVLQVLQSAKFVSLVSHALQDQ